MFGVKKQAALEPKDVSFIGLGARSKELSKVGAVLCCSVFKNAKILSDEARSENHLLENTGTALGILNSVKALKRGQGAGLLSGETFKGEFTRVSSGVVLVSAPEALLVSLIKKELGLSFFFDATDEVCKELLEPASETALPASLSQQSSADISFKILEAKKKSDYFSLEVFIREKTDLEPLKRIFSGFLGLTFYPKVETTGAVSLLIQGELEAADTKIALSLLDKENQFLKESPAAFAGAHGAIQIILLQTLTTNVYGY